MLANNSAKSEDYEVALDDRLKVIAGGLTILIMLVGLSGNLLTIVALVKCPRIRNVAAAFIISLCIADGLFCAVVLPFNVVRFFGSKLFSHEEVLCKLIPFLQYANVGLSLLFIAMITINRYVMIAHYRMYSKIYRPINVAGMIIFCLLLSFGMQIPTLLGVWGVYRYDRTLNVCSIKEDIQKHSAKTSLFMVGFVVPCAVIICCYTRIFWVVRNSEQTMQRHTLSTNSQIGRQDTTVTKETKRKRNEWRVTKMVLVIFLSFLICYLPITVVKVVDIDVKHLHFHIISYIMLYLSACINPIIYVIMNKQYRKAYGNVITCKPARVFNLSTVKRKEEPPSKTLMSQVSVSMIPMNVMDHQKVNHGT